MSAPHAIHILGASGAGTSTLGQAFERGCGFKWLDTDGFFWQQDDPPFTNILPREERIRLLAAAIEEHPKCVISGSLCGWGDVFIPQFGLVIYVDTPTDIRLERLKNREAERFGDRIREGGDMFENHRDFLEWAAKYDDGGLDMRSRALHEEWLKNCPCPVIRVDGTADCEQTVADIIERFCTMKTEDMHIICRHAAQTDIDLILARFAEQGDNKPREVWETYLREQESGGRIVIIAEINGEIAGYVTLFPKAKDAVPYLKSGMPEIKDFNVFERFRRRGAGTILMDKIEEAAAGISVAVCLGVGLHSGYGAAQRLYVKRGYIPDGTGIWYQGKACEQYAECRNDDDLVLYMSKELR